MITTNLVFSEWECIFKDPMTTMAAIDRLIHHSVILDMMSVESYRAEVASQQQVPSARPKKQPSKRASRDEAMTPASVLVADTTSAHLLIAEHADIETREVATSNRHV